MTRRVALPLIFVTWMAAGEARADEPLVLRESWAGTLDFLSTGAPLAKDSNNDGKVDALAQPGKVTVGALDVPNGAMAISAYLYWGATQMSAGCQGDAHLDKQVTFTPPGGAASAVVADVCYCSPSPSYDMQLCRADVVGLLDGLTGEYAVEDLGAQVSNTDTANASFAVVLVYRAPGLPQRRIGLYDGLLGLVQGMTPTTKLVFDDVKVTNPPQGDLTWYALEGDVAANTGEFVEVKALPGGGVAKLSDGINPSTNPFNRTINTTVPTQIGVTGVDIDRFSLGMLAEDDQTLEITYSAGIDKYWIAFNLIGVDVFEPLFSDLSTKTWLLTDDVGGDGEPSPGDTVTYTIHLENTGTAEGTITVTDPIAAEVASWVLIEDGGGSDMSGTDTLIVADVGLQPLQATDIVLDVVIADVPDLTPVNNTAEIDGDGGPAQIVAPVLVVRRDGDADGKFDSDDNCPEVANADQADDDMNGIGDACEAPADTTSETGSESSGVGETNGETGGETSGETGSEGSGGGESGGGETSVVTGTGGGGTGGGDPSGEVPTGPGPGVTSGGDEAMTSSSGGSSGGDTATSADGGGCGCNGTGRIGGVWALALLGLRRRRRCTRGARPVLASCVKLAR